LEKKRETRIWKEIAKRVIAGDCIREKVSQKGRKRTQTHEKKLGNEGEEWGGKKRTEAKISSVQKRKSEGERNTTRKEGGKERKGK